ncbi:hypothetical protein SAMN04489806_0962 [Paramicrobacterium humi]|uniref:Uncharacterized protein n=1 Tax=Paramicrobacterium humi TaxID=640635 RepID=A0A1H4K174_9MICO|nr:hypothetical protein SAMN04489806_0962 [Microbacterium humi]
MIDDVSQTRDAISKACDENGTGIVILATRGG